MKRFTKSVAVMLSASMLMTLGACQDNSRDEVLDLAEDVAEYTVDRNYSKLSKLTEDGDEDLEEIFEAIEADDCREVVASTLEYEIDEDSLEKDGKTGYTIDVTFTYADYEDVLENEEINSADDFEDAVNDCDEVIEETVTLEFEKDGSDFLFVNISDLEGLFPYYDEFLVPDIVVDDENVGGSDVTPTVTVNPGNPADTNQTTTSATETSETEFDLSTYDLGGLWNDDRYPDPELYYEDGVTYLLPNTAILFTVPEDAPLTGLNDNGIDSCFFMIGGYWGTTWEDYYSIVDGMPGSCWSQDALDRRYANIDLFSENEPGYVSHELSTIDLTYYGVTYEGVLSTIQRANGEIIYRCEVIIGNDDFYYIIGIRTRNMDDIINFGENFTIVDY